MLRLTVTNYRVADKSFARPGRKQGRATEDFDVHSKSCVQQEEDYLYQQNGLKFEEETSKMLHLEHGFVWC